MKFSQTEKGESEENPIDVEPLADVLLSARPLLALVLFGISPTIEPKIEA